jgi:hypothetical protein
VVRHANSLKILGTKRNYLRGEWPAKKLIIVLTSVLSWTYPELLHPRKQRGAIHPQAGSGSIVTTNTSFAFRKSSDDRVTLFSHLFVIHAFIAIQRVNRFFYNSGDVVTVFCDDRVRRLVQASSA